jgi:beta-N-acetylhexosaminidase
MIQIWYNKAKKERGTSSMKKGILSAIFILCLFGLVGCNIDGKEEQPNTTKTEDLDEATLTGMAKDITADMSLKDKIGQLFMVEVSTLDKKSPTKVSEAMKKSLKKYSVGGVVLFSKNIKTREQTKALIDDLQKASYIPLFISADEEGGDIARVSNNANMNMTSYPTAEEIGSSYSKEQIKNMGTTQSKELKALGFNMNLAPVADVRTNQENTEIGNRSFGTKASEVASIISTLVKSMQSQQISATLKHFPGSGGVVGNTHRGMVESKDTIQQLRKTEFLPFKSGIESKVDGIMVSHIVLSNVCDTKEPASVSERVVTEILRKELEYDGMIITDAFNMNAITNKYTSSEAALKAVQAGVDIVLMPEDLKKAYNAVYEAVKQGKIKESRIDQSVRRIIYTKIKRGAIPPDTTLIKNN